MLIGYAGISAGERTLDLQSDALYKAGCGKTRAETASGAKDERPVLGVMQGYLRAGRHPGRLAPGPAGFARSST